MRVKYVFIAFVVSFSSKGHCFRNGYSKETCDDMVPNHEPGEPNVTLSNHRCPYKFNTESVKYTRNRELEISIIGEDIMGFQLQFRKSESDKIRRVGEFVSTPDGAKFLQCDEGKNTAVTNNNLEPKKDLTFKWRAPKENMGNILLWSSLVSGDKYWTGCSDILLEYADFPVSIDDCGVKKSCVRYSSDGSNCDGNTCSYLLTYYKSGEKTVTFSLSGVSMDRNRYTAVGFKREKDGNFDFNVCARQKETVALRHFILDNEKGQYELTGDLQNILTDSEGNSFWCEFSTSVKSTGTSLLDFNKEIEWVYAWGKINAENEPDVENDTWYEATHNISELISVTLHSNGSNNIPVTAFILIFLSSFSLIISQM